MRRHVVIVGAGFAGLELATRLSDTLGDAIRVTLVDRNDSFYFGFSKLDVLLGRQAPEDVLLHYRDIAKEGVEFRQETVWGIDPVRRRVITDQRTYDADFLAVALGADYDMAATPGFREGGFEYYTLAGAERLREALAGFTEGTVVIGVLGHPFKCPPAPFEGAFLLDDLFVKRGVRDAVDIRMTFPMAAPVPVTKEVSQMFLCGARRARNPVLAQGVGGGAGRSGERTAHLLSGRSMPYDLFIGIPVHRVPDVVARSRLVVDGWVPVDQTNLATRYPGVYALGDVASGGRRSPRPECLPRPPHGSSPPTSPHSSATRSPRHRTRATAPATSSSATASWERSRPTSSAGRRQPPASWRHRASSPPKRRRSAPPGDAVGSIVARRPGIRQRSHRSRGRE